MQESNLARLASQQARREEEVNQARQRAAELEAEVADLSREVELRQEQEVALKEVSRLRVKGLRGPLSRGSDRQAGVVGQSRFHCLKFCHCLRLQSVNQYVGR